MKWILAASLILMGPVIVKAQENTLVSDVVKKMREDDEGVVVLFSKAKGSYYLRRELEEFATCKKKLEDSLSSKKPVSVTVEPTLLNILEVK